MDNHGKPGSLPRILLTTPAPPPYDPPLWLLGPGSRNGGHTCQYPPIWEPLDVFSLLCGKTMHIACQLQQRYPPPAVVIFEDPMRTLPPPYKGLWVVKWPGSRSHGGYCECAFHIGISIWLLSFNHPMLDARIRLFTPTFHLSGVCCA